MSRPSNMNYRFLIKHNGFPEGENTVMGYLPEQFELRLQSDWEPMLAGLMDNAVNSLVRGATGYGIHDKLLTAQIWRNSDPIEFGLTVQFDAIRDAKKDVTEPVQRLIQWVLPKRGSGSAAAATTIEAPGPSIGGEALGGSNNRISIRIGKFLYFDNVIIPSMDVTWFTAPDASGQFIGADVNLSIRTFYTPDSTDVLQFFQAGANATDFSASPIVASTSTIFSGLRSGISGIADSVRSTLSGAAGVVTGAADSVAGAVTGAARAAVGSVTGGGASLPPPSAP